MSTADAFPLTVKFDPKLVSNSPETERNQTTFCDVEIAEVECELTVIH